MKRQVSTPRRDWEATVQKQGLIFHLTQGRPYWDESAYYEFSATQIDELEAASQQLEAMCNQAVGHVVASGPNGPWWNRFAIAPTLRPWIIQSWRDNQRPVYGRFDLAYDGQTIKLLEYNADTPTGLIEAAVIQWFWMNDVWGVANVGQEVDQWNSLHERLIAAWAKLKSGGGKRLYCSGIDDGYEDFMTVQYLRDTATQAGWDAPWIEINRIGWSKKLNAFVDERDQPIERIFKLYPWEWLARERFGPYLPQAATSWIEPPWKMLLSNKALLVLLWELFPDHALLLRAGFEAWGDSWVRKPLLGREGANTSIQVKGQTLQASEGPYQGLAMYQEYFPLPLFEGATAILGAWMIDGQAAGMGIREENGLITTNQSRFIPHIFRP